MMVPQTERNRFASFPKIQDAIAGLREDETGHTTFLTAGDLKAKQAIFREANHEIEKLVLEEKISALSLDVFRLSELDSDPRHFQFDAKFQPGRKRELKAKHEHFIAEAMLVPVPGQNDLGFAWAGLLLVLGMDLVEDDQRLRQTDQGGNSKRVGGIEPYSVHNPDLEALEKIMVDFAQAELNMLKDTRKRLRKSCGSKKHPARFKIEDGLSQFATLVPLRKTIFGHGLGQEVIKRALIGLEADIKLAKKRRGPDQLQMQHVWWQYKAAKKSRILDPLQIFV